MAKKVNIEITNPVGLYASPATELVDAVKLYKSHVTLNYNEKSVNMKSLMGVLSLGIPHKAKIEIVVEGEDEGTAMDLIFSTIISIAVPSSSPSTTISIFAL